MAHNTSSIPAHLLPQRLPGPRLLLSEQTYDRPLWKSLAEQLYEWLFPVRRPALRLTSRPVPVRDLWGGYNYRKKSLMGSTIVHGAFIVGLVVVSMAGTKVANQVQNEVVTPLIAPDPSTYLPTPAKSEDTVSGGGGGGDRDPLPAPRGRLPRHSMEQLAPPAMVIRNAHPKLAVEPTVVIPPQVHLAAVNMPNLGVPAAVALAGPPSNGIGSGGGIGSGNGGGIGSGEGPGVGPGRGGGIGGGVFHVGGGVSAPRAIFTPDPEYTGEARKAKLQGVCVLWMIVGADGLPRDIKVSRPLGMGLDQKAVEAVRQWKFEPARKGGQPVSVQINVEVSFKLY